MKPAGLVPLGALVASDIRARLGLRREASLATCALECGAQCCRHRDMVVFLTPPEMRDLKARAEALGVTVPVRHMPRRPGSTAPWAYRLADTGGVCVFLDQATNACRVYEHRPRACVTFPSAPEAFCLLWPLPAPPASATPITPHKGETHEHRE